MQYCIWRADLSGTLLFESLARAAERGVRVRLLLDDQNTAGLAATLATLDAHPNIEVRLFNPFAHCTWRWLGYLGDFARLNRRTHNKPFTADNQASIIGGRNVGDEYFGAGEGPLFADLDVPAVGPVVDAVSTDFDRYWASDSAYPADRLLPRPSPQDRAGPAAAAQRLRQEPAAAAYVQALARTPLVREPTAGTLEFKRASTPAQQARGPLGTPAAGGAPTGGWGSSAGSALSAGSASSASLHAKTFAVDRARVFVGSFNFDPRSARLDTELGSVIASPALAQALADAFADRIPRNAFEVRLLDGERLQWVEHRAGPGGEVAVVRHPIEPGTSVWQRLGVRVLSVLPIEWLLQRRGRRRVTRS